VEKAEWIAKQNIERFSKLLDESAPDGVREHVVSELINKEKRKLPKRAVVATKS